MVKIVASSILILAVLMIRAVFQKKIDPLFLYPVWLAVALRLLLPGMLFSSPASIMNTKLWEAGSRMIAEENSRQDKLYKQQRYQEYYEKITAETAMPLKPETESDPAGQEKGKIVGVESAQATERTENMEETVSFELKWKPAATPFGKIRQAARTVWVIGMLFFTAVFGWQNLCFYRYLRSTRRKWADYPVGRRKITVFTAGDKLASPCLFGLFPAVYIPASGKKAGLSMALAHEAVHYRHGDHIWALVRIVCLITNWYNPLVWVCARLSIRDGELACDAGCIRRLGEDKRSAYGEALIAMIRQTKKRKNMFQHATMMTSGKKFMAKRIECIAQNRKGSKVSLALMIIILFFCAGCTYTGAGHLEEVSKPSATASTGEDPVWQEQTGSEKAVLPETGSEETKADKERIVGQANAGLEDGAAGSEKQMPYGGKAVVLTEQREGPGITLAGKIFLLIPGNGPEGESYNIVLLDTDLYVPDLQGNLKKLDVICQSYEKEEILKILNSSMDLRLNEIDIFGYDAFMQKVDEAGGIPADVTENEIVHINNYLPAVTGEELPGKNEVTETGNQVLNGIQTAAYLQIRYSPAGYGGMMDRWKQVVCELLKQDGIKAENFYGQFFSGLDKSVYMESEKENYLLCFQWEEGVKEMHDRLYSGSSYQPSGHVKELDAAMKKQAEKAISGYRNENTRIFFLFGEYIGKSPYMVSLLRGEDLGPDTESAWESLEVYASGSSLREDLEDGRAVYAVNLVFEDSGILDFPESGQEGISVERFLYLVRKGDGWYVDGPLHNDLPPDNWWAGEEYSWKSYDFGFSDEDSLGVVIKGQEEYDTFIKEVREAVGN